MSGSHFRFMELDTGNLLGDRVILEPMRPEHLDGLVSRGLDESIWRIAVDRIRGREEMAKYVDDALRDRELGSAVPFGTLLADSHEIVGSTRFGNIDVYNRKVEIGWTWIIPKWQRSFVNTEAKLLMLTHAFETWNCIRVEFKTDALNVASRAAIARLGAVEEGILRQHMITDTGRFRDSVYFSILDHEWPSVKSALLEKLRERK